MATPHKCPVCDGAGKVSRPPWVAGYVQDWGGSSARLDSSCHACSGTGIVWEIVLNWTPPSVPESMPQTQKGAT